MMTLIMLLKEKENKKKRKLFILVKFMKIMKINKCFN